MLAIPEGAPDVPVLVRHHLVDLVARPVAALGRRAADARDDVNVQVRHRLARLGAVLDRDVERAVSGMASILLCFFSVPVCSGWRWGSRAGEIVPRQHVLNALHRLHQVRQLRGREIGEPLVRLLRANQDVTRQQRLQIHQGEGVRRSVENLEWVSKYTYWFPKEAQEVSSRYSSIVGSAIFPLFAGPVCNYLCRPDRLKVLLTCDVTSNGPNRSGFLSELALIFRAQVFNDVLLYAPRTPGFIIMAVRYWLGVYTCEKTCFWNLLSIAQMTSARSASG